MSRFAYLLTLDKEAELTALANQLVEPGKGILCTDESPVTCGNKFKQINLENTVENRRRYREVIFSCIDSIVDYISGVLLFDETARQFNSYGVNFVEYLTTRGIICGIKVDKGVVYLGGTHKESATVGLDGLKERCDDYKSMGIQFTKWRSILKVSRYTPSNMAMMENANTLARYASISQQSGLVPIIELEVLPDGDFDMETSCKILEQALGNLYRALTDNNVFLEGTLLKTNMAIPGLSYRGQMQSPLEIAHATVSVFDRRVPAAIPGIVFLSGSQGEESETLSLNEVNKVNLPRPWRLTFSLGRLFQTKVLRTWEGDDENIRAVHAWILNRAKANSMASLGRYVEYTEQLAKDDDYQTTHDERQNDESSDLQNHEYSTSPIHSIPASQHTHTCPHSHQCFHCLKYNECCHQLQEIIQPCYNPVMPQNYVSPTDETQYQQKHKSRAPSNSQFQRQDKLNNSVSAGDDIFVQQKRESRVPSIIENSNQRESQVFQNDPGSNQTKRESRAPSTTESNTLYKRESPAPASNMDTTVSSNRQSQVTASNMSNTIPSKYMSRAASNVENTGPSKHDSRFSSIHESSSQSQPEDPEN